ncbi:type II secretion system protein [Candidatus Zixiibacteriota bacterium]
MNRDKQIIRKLILMVTIGNKARLFNQSGFSLIELVIILIAISVLAALAIQSMSALMSDMRQIKTEREMEMLSNAIVGDPEKRSGGNRLDFGYVGDIGSFPPNLDALKSNPGGYATWNGPYIPAGFSEDTDGFKTDEWGSIYNYSGGVIINSTGSGMTMSKKIADATGDYLLNSYNSTILDSAGAVPGAVYRDSVSIKITIPNGTGGTTSKYYQPDSLGAFSLDSLPVGQHPIQIIYTPNVDTLINYVTILPRHKSGRTYKFASTYFGSGGSSSSVETLYPDGVGTSTDLTGSGCSDNWDCVNDTPHDGNGSYVAGSGNSYKNDTYSTQNHSSGTGTIDSVKVFLIINGGGGCRAKTIIRTGGTDYEGSDINLAPVSSFNEYSTIYTTNPNTSSPWTWTEIDDLEIGVSIRRAAPCTQIRLEVYYTN